MSSVRKYRRHNRRSSATTEQSNCWVIRGYKDRPSSSGETGSSVGVMFTSDRSPPQMLEQSSFLSKLFSFPSQPLYMNRSQLCVTWSQYHRSTLSSQEPMTIGRLQMSPSNRSVSVDKLQTSCHMNALSRPRSTMHDVTYTIDATRACW